MKVTIIIPVYNGEKFLKKTLESVKNLKYDNFDVLIIEDVSTDGSLRIINDFIKNDERFKLLKNEKNEGIIKNIERGIGMSTSEYILNLGQDDILEEGHLEKMVSSLEKNDSFIYCNSILINSNGEKIGALFREEKNKKKLLNYKTKLGKRNFINSCGLIYNREKAIKVGAFKKIDGLRNYGEWIAWIRLSKVGKIKYCTEIRSRYRKHDTNISNSFIEPSKRINLLRYYSVVLKEILGIYKNEYTLLSRVKIKRNIFLLKVEIIFLTVCPNSIYERYSNILCKTKQKIKEKLIYGN